MTDNNKRAKYNEELFLHNINNHLWYYPRRHGIVKDSIELMSEIFTFDDSSVTFQANDNSKIYLL